MKIVTGRYENPEKVLGWHGWIEDKKRSWIIFYRPGELQVYASRDKSGGVRGAPETIRF